MRRFIRSLLYESVLFRSGGDTIQRNLQPMHTQTQPTGKSHQALADINEDRMDADTTSTSAPVVRPSVLALTAEAQSNSVPDHVRRVGAGIAETARRSVFKSERYKSERRDGYLPTFRVSGEVDRDSMLKALEKISQAQKQSEFNKGAWKEGDPSVKYDKFMHMYTRALYPSLLLTSLPSP